MKIIRIALIVAFMISLTVLTSVCVAGEILPSTPIRLQASWYSRADLIRDGQDKRTHFVMANGKVFYDDFMVCASWDYPLNSLLLVTNLDNGLSVVVKNSDRTAKRFKGKRCDLSKGAFSRIASCKQGVVPVLVERVG